MAVRTTRRERLVRTGGLVVGCTAVLTASFVGLAALLTGASEGVAGRVPLYILAMAVAFVASVVGLEEALSGPRRVIVTAAIVALAGFVFVTLSVEGLVHAVAHPGRIVASQLLAYFLAAGLIGTGVGYWGLNHWREMARKRVGRSR
jgi:hypothetical protein